jgi:hypothetical protein
LTAPLAFLLSGCSDAERAARCRELRALALLLCGAAHPLTVALAEAITNPAAADRALAELLGFLSREAGVFPPNQRAGTAA